MRPAGSLVVLLATLAYGRAARADGPPEALPVTIAATPATLQLGVDHAARIEITVPGDTGADVLELVASTGTMGDLVRVSPGHFAARYDPPSTRAPDVAIIVARVRGTPRAGFTAVPLAGRYHLTVTVEPRARVEVRAGNVVERRASVPASGILDVVLHIAPGVDHATIVATDRSGNTTESQQAIDVPPLHRILVVPAPPPATPAHALAWWVVATASDATPLVTPPTTDVTGALAELTVIAPGFFLVVARPAVRVEPTTVRVVAHALGAVAVPDEVVAMVPAVVPASVLVAPLAAVQAGASVTATAAVLDTDGQPMSDLGAVLSARIADGPAVSVTPRGASYVLESVAPERVGVYQLTVTLARSGVPAVSTALALRVNAATPSRLSLDSAPTLTVGSEARLVFRILDRFGNAAVVTHPDIAATGARILDTQISEGRVALRAVPSALVVRITVRGDYDFRDAVDVPAIGSASRPLSLSALGSARTNLGASVLLGGRLRLAARERLPGRFRILEMLDAGVEGTTTYDGQGRSAQVIAIPLVLRGALAVELGPVDLGVVAGLGVDWVLLDVHYVDGSDQQNSLPVFAAEFGALLRWTLPVGVLWLEAGWQYAQLDSFVATGTLGGIYGLLGWGITF